MWVDILPIQIAKDQPFAKLDEKREEEYELRLIIWQTMSVPLVDGVADINKNERDKLIFLQTLSLIRLGGRNQTSTNPHPEYLYV